jgi:hypothetical protein
MQTVTKTEFKSTYFRHSSVATGWTADCWQESFESVNDMTWCIEYPETPAHSRMFIVHDFATREIRMLFLTEESEESFFRQGSDDQD